MPLFSKKSKGKRPYVSAVIAAAGSSSRMGGENKLLMEIDNVPVLVHTLRAFCDAPLIDEIVIAARADLVIDYANLAAQYGLEKVSRVIAGGASRLESVYQAIAQVDERCAFVAVHDGARPLVTVEEIVAVCEAAFVHSCAITALPVYDTIKQAVDGRVQSTLSRENLYRAQTPQVADKALLFAALQQGLDQKASWTDESMALEHIGKPPVIVEGSAENIKITTPADVQYAEMVLTGRRYS